MLRLQTAKITRGIRAEDIEVAKIPSVQGDAKVEPSIFRNYDIRGVVGETLTLKSVYEIGRAVGTEAVAGEQRSVITARDGRNSSRELRDALAKGLRDSGCDVFDIGLTPTPVLYFATHYLNTNNGVMITGSHNPPEYNGIKIVLDGETLSGDAIQTIRKRVEAQNYTTGEGVIQSMEVLPEYIRRVSEEIPPSLGDSFKVVVDCGNSVPGIVAPQILRALGHEVIELYCKVDGNFPNHHPDPSQPENLSDLIRTVRDEGADLGLAFDGDGDRLGVVDRGGKIIWPDRQMILFANDVLSRNPGAKIIYDVKCSGVLHDAIKKQGGEPIMAQTGHSLIKKKMKDTGALLAGEMSGHIFFKERWYGFDDAMYAAARLLEILSTAGGSLDEVFGTLPDRVSTSELRLEMPEQEHAEFMQNVLAGASFENGVVTTIDGLRVDFPDSWGLIRPSNTTPCLVLRFEGDDKAALDTIKNRFRELLTKIDRKLDLPF
ncbi:MAG TPA: phosphomannomutase/phosphoglucomutase [Gammaproteobacteria bacterium]|nr:phosphomannomutase/phosphoglucomutase [Gammaproteobacteria bacterium]|tara:strand:- start:2455 stop:3921 length:1467 start_codon:yes stop_codon:yes gene_type:complete